MLSIDQDQDLQREVVMKAVRAREGNDSTPEITEEALFAALNALRADYREIFILKHVDNLSYKEIAELLGMTVSAVGEKLYRVRTMVREKLEKDETGSKLS
jgi:RNA polymerase sigma-70 factor (ECF subfamily)